MPDIKLELPKNSKFHSSLNEIDMVMGKILLEQMRIADPRSKLRKQDISANPTKNDWLWDESRTFQVDELTTEEIFDTYLLRMKINNKKGVDVSYPLLAYLQNDIETVFWGTGNRYKQNYFDIPAEPESWEVGDSVVILEPFKYRGTKAIIQEVRTVGSSLKCVLSLNDVIITQKIKNKKEPILFDVSSLRQTGDKTPERYKAKAITGTYTAVILVDNRDEAQYIRDKFILRCSDARIWFSFNSPTINNAKNQIFTVFNIPNLQRYPASKDKLKGEGFIYGVAFDINYWACLTDTPLPQSLIETIRMNIHVEGDGRTNRIVINM